MPRSMAHTKHDIWNEVEPNRVANQRRHGRVRCQDIHCTIGTVEDLSVSGLRVSGKGRVPVQLGDTFSITIHTLDGPMLAPVRVAWVSKLRWRRFEIGMMFCEVGPELSRALCSIARRAAHNETLARDQGSDAGRFRAA